MARNKEQLLTQLRRIEGQVRGIQKMLEEDRYCIDILIQIQAARASLTQVGLSVLDGHVKGCVVKAVQHGDNEILDELMDAVKKFSR